MAKLRWFGTEKVPRRFKKYILGRKIPKYKLKKMLSEVTLGEPIKTMYEDREIKPYGQFCPKCGCTAYYGTGNRVEYPEHWESFYCLRCDVKVAEIDNSPFVHVLECDGFKFD